MDLWIRSQDKTKLIKVENIMIIEDVIEGMTIVDVSKGETIQPPIKSEIMIIASDEFVGNYKTKERALEVLDEIQNIIMPKPILQAKSILSKKNIERMQDDYGMKVLPSCVDVIESTSFVYEMPVE